jgi:hypothetical protein
MLSCKCSLPAAGREFRMQECRNAGMQEYRNTGIQEYRNE